MRELPETDRLGASGIRPDVRPEKSKFIFLQPGGLVMTDVPTVVKTVLGSCVSLTIRAPRFGLAAVTHCLLPCATRRRQQQLTHREALKFVDSTVALVFDEFLARGAANRDLEVKLIGGADGISNDGTPFWYSVGKNNVEMALRQLTERGIQPAACIVGGRTGRVLVYDTATGDVFVKRLPARLCAFQEEL